MTMATSTMMMVTCVHVTHGVFSIYVCVLCLRVYELNGAVPTFCFVAKQYLTSKPIKRPNPIAAGTHLTPPSEGW